jgi:hypothetical protein
MGFGVLGSLAGVLSACGERDRVTPVGIFGDREVDIVPGPLHAPKLAADGWLAAYPPDTLAAIREAIGGAVVGNAFERVGILDTAPTSAKPTSAGPSAPARSHP